MTTLFSTKIRQVTTAPIVGTKVLVRNNSGAMYALAEGRKWVRKTKVSIGEHGIIAEAIGWLWSRKLELLVPDVAAYVPGKFEEDCWLSEVVDGVSHWSAQRTPVANLPMLGGLLALDVILINADRHDGNILLEPLIDGKQECWRVWGIDFGNAGVGFVESVSDMEEELPSTKVLPRDLPFEALKSFAIEIAQEIERWDDLFIIQSVSEACSVAGNHEPEDLIEVLKKRCNKAVSLVERYFGPLLETT